ncbi:TIGR01777 family oxidoreductase [Nocardioides sp.]|uniref:TIGR01777 family oxidoreductase n=1 Tax=Nocardioides sp. TaxID=35761 RepID=UPI002D80704B|nr:TIGR01777 family oxidoreductase [Nocardioides sp.]HET8960814.1 TIGR01777 family oxidoreductase [Nocardioides sp.]
MRILIAGASGFLGSHLVQRFRTDGHDVTRLVRRTASGSDESAWDPYAGELDQDAVEAADVVVNLAGTPTAGNPHSQRWARELEESRVTTTRVLAGAIARAEGKPAFLAGNGISFYGDHGADQVTEESDSRGDALLTRVTQVWQAAAEPAAESGARVCVLRTAPVMDRRSPPLKQMRVAFSLGLGTRLGDGRQYFPMISLRDWVGAVAFLAGNDSVSGPFNLCCPEPPTNGEFTETLASALGRKAFLSVPKVALKVGAGQMSPELLGSVRARPAALEKAGYEFLDPDVRAVVAAALA